MQLSRSVFSAGLLLEMIVMSVSAIAETPAPAQLSITVTNKFGDVFTNLVVSKVLKDGLVLEHKAGQVKVKYSELPDDVRKKYEPLAAVADLKERQDAALNHAFVEDQRRNQAEQSRLRAARQQQQLTPQRSEPTTVRIGVPNQGWGVTFLNAGFRELGNQISDSQFVYRAMGQNGFNLSLFVETPANASTAHNDVFNYYWSKASRNPLIEQQSVKIEKKENFVKVSYTTLDLPNANYYFAYRGKWVDLHISRSVPARKDATLFPDFDESLSYGE